jgi:hypothetical protein
MELICVQGETPGPVVATLSHGARIRQVSLTVVTHPAGGWRVQLPQGGFGPRCHAAATAILLEAGEVFAADDAAPAAEKLAAD